MFKLFFLCLAQLFWKVEYQTQCTAGARFVMIKKNWLDGKLCQPAHKSVKHGIFCVRPAAGQILRAILFCPEPLRTQQNWTDSGHQTLG